MCLGVLGRQESSTACGEDSSARRWRGQGAFSTLERVTESPCSGGPLDPGRQHEVLGLSGPCLLLPLS